MLLQFGLFFIKIGLVMVFVLLIIAKTEKKNSYKTNVVNNLDYHFKITITKNIFALLICQCTKKSDVRHIILYYRALAGLIMWQSVSELKSIVCIKQFISFVFVCYTKKPLELFLSCSCNLKKTVTMIFLFSRNDLWFENIFYVVIHFVRTWTE